MSGVSVRPARPAARVVPLTPLVAAHPLEDSSRLAWQATAAVGLLERFGDLVTTALDAVSGGDDRALVEALHERERLLVQLEPLLADLSAARHRLAREPEGAAARQAIESILRPVDEALRYANLLHVQLEEPRRTAPLVLVP